MIEAQGSEDVSRKKLWEKSIYELSEELKQKNTNPSVDSYGEPNTFINYKLGRFYERTDIVELKKAKIREKHEFLKEIQKMQKVRDREERHQRLLERRLA